MSRSSASPPTASSAGRAPDWRSAANSVARSSVVARSSLVRLARSTATSATAPTAMASPTTSTAATVVRTRTVPSRGRLRRRSAAIGHQQPVGAVQGRADGEALGSQPPLVLHHQHPHRTVFPQATIMDQRT